MTMRVIHDTGFTGSGQGAGQTRIVETPAGTRVQATVRCDSTERQAYVKADRWDGAAWQQVIRLDGTQVTIPNGYQPPPGPVADVRVLIDYVLDVALDVIGEAP